VAEGEEGRRGVGGDPKLMGLVFALMEFTPREREDDTFGYLWEGVEL